MGLATTPKWVAKWRSRIEKSRSFWKKRLQHQQKIWQTSSMMLYGLTAWLSRILLARCHLDLFMVSHPTSSLSWSTRPIGPSSFLILIWRLQGKRDYFNWIRLKRSALTLMRAQKFTKREWSGEMTRISTNRSSWLAIWSASSTQGWSYFWENFVWDGWAPLKWRRITPMKWLKLAQKLAGTFKVNRSRLNYYVIGAPIKRPSRCWFFLNSTLG